MRAQLAVLPVKPEGQRPVDQSLAALLIPDVAAILLGLPLLDRKRMRVTQRARVVIRLIR